MRSRAVELRARSTRDGLRSPDTAHGRKPTLRFPMQAIPGAFARRGSSSGPSCCSCFGPCPVSADAPPITHPAADPVGYRSFSVGDVKVFPLQDATGSMPLDRVFPDADPAGEVAAFLNSEGNLSMSFGCVLLQSAGLNILCDTSCGDVVQPAPQPPHRHLPELLLAAAGLTPADIDIVAYSHAHGDHVAGGIVYDSAGDLVPAFPHARYLIRERELAPQLGSQNYETFFAPLEEAGLLEAIPSEGDYALTRDVVLLSGYRLFSQCALPLSLCPSVSLCVPLCPCVSLCVAVCPCVTHIWPGAGMKGTRQACRSHALRHRQRRRTSSETHSTCCFNSACHTTRQVSILM